MGRHAGRPAHRCLWAGQRMSVRAPSSCGSAFLGLCPVAFVCLLDGAELSWKFASLPHSLVLPLWAPSLALLSAHLLAGFPRDPEPPNHSKVTLYDSIANIPSPRVRATDFLSTRKQISR